MNPDLVVRDKSGQIYTVRYDAVNAMLLNEFLKEHKRIEEQQATIAQLNSTVAQERKATEILTTQFKSRPHRSKSSALSSPQRVRPVRT